MPEHINIDVDFDNSIETTAVTGESIIVPSVANFKGGTRYVVRLKYVPYLGDPANLPTIAGLTRVEGSSPASGEFRIVEQALNLTHVSPNILEFNSAQAGNSYTVNYLRYAENQDAQKVVYHDVLRDVVKSDNIDLDFNTTQILIGSGSYYYFRDKIIIEDTQVVVSDTLSASTTYYVYCDDYKGTNFYEGVYSISTTAPSFSTALLGWYNSNSKAICKFITDGSSNIISVESLGYQHPQLKILSIDSADTTAITLNNYEDYDLIEIDPSIQAVTITLPSAAAINKGKRLKFQQIEDGGKITISGTIGGFTNLFLDAKNASLEIYSNGAAWEIIKYYNFIESGFINRSDWTNIKFGFMQVDYDNLTGTFLVGELLVEYSDVGRTTPTGIAGIIIDDDGTTLTLKNITGFGIFTNNLYLKGDTSLATADVNEPSGSTKNTDCTIIHNYGIDIDKFKLRTYISTDGTSNNSFAHIEGGWSGDRGTQLFQLDNNELEYYGGLSGIYFMNKATTGSNILDTEDYYYNHILEFKI